METGSLRDWLVVYAKGVLMGAADTVPGVSGGTIALITGIYERLVDAVASLDPAPLRHVPRLHREAARHHLVVDLRERDVAFLAVLGLGVATAVVLLSRFMHTALVQYPGPTNALFFGLIAASAAVLYTEVAVDTPGRILAGIGGFVLAFLVTGVSGGGGLGHALPVVFAAGAVASAAMLLPGISGAAFLYILGQYTFLTGRLERFVDAVLALPGAPATLGTDAAVVAVFLAGVGTGLLTVARAVRWALHRSRPATMTFLISLMAGSLRLPVERVLAAPGGVSPAAVAAAGAGIAVVVAVDRATTGATP